ncbi:Ger(x)C family spore germination protein [Paludicola sp. MB14-C6]|uniref:Ger(x)C family spore germination protein n=1 Tax=Paludihabitans sp. MB14-C6 TaxID=3070656 RepID=UPI0027DCF9DC|nr:Ger(x)C family spore germination protein [Paludicola sp. MB14-C6]WMJ23493.1 Ger(x)C family spore germination protein [Paludicola sp. MB14-C6]
MRTKLILLLMLLSSCIILSSCIPSQQLNSRALVQAIGLDYENDEIQLTLQIFSPAAEGANGLGASSKNAKIIESQGKTISEAVQNANLVQGKEVFVGHNRIIILGTNFVQNKLNEALSYFSSIQIARKNASIVIGESKASEIIKADINQGILPAETLQKIIENNSNKGLIENIMFYEFVRAYQSDEEGALLPVFSLNQSKQTIPTVTNQNEKKNKGETLEKVSNLQISGMAVLKQGKIVGKLDENETQGVLWIRNTIQNTKLVTSTDKFKIISLDFYHTKSKITPSINGDNIKLIINIDCQSTLNEAILYEHSNITSSDIQDIKKVAAKKIEEKCLKAYNKTINEYNVDVLNFGRIIEKNDKELWKKLKNNWEDNAHKIKFEIHASVDTNRVGLNFEKS